MKINYKYVIFLFLAVLLSMTFTSAYRFEDKTYYYNNPDFQGTVHIQKSDNILIEERNTITRKGGRVMVDNSYEEYPQEFHNSYGFFEHYSSDYYSYDYQRYLPPRGSCERYYNGYNCYGQSGSNWRTMRYHPYYYPYENDYGYPYYYESTWDEDDGVYNWRY